MLDKARAGVWQAPVDIDWTVPEPPGRWFADPARTVLGVALRRAGRGEEQCRQAVRDEIGYGIAQIMHGEIAAVEHASALAADLPDADLAACARTQVVDEARHAEVFDRYLRLRIGCAWPMHPELAELLHLAAAAPSWLHRCVALQVLIEGVALGRFAGLQATVPDPLLRSILHRVSADEARHTAFGALALERHLPRLDARERRELAGFALHVVERFHAGYGAGVIDVLAPAHGLDAAELLRRREASWRWRETRALVFRRGVVPALRSAGLLEAPLRDGLAALGILHDQEIP